MTHPEHVQRALTNSWLAALALGPRLHLAVGISLQTTQSTEALAGGGEVLVGEPSPPGSTADRGSARRESALPAAVPRRSPTTRFPSGSRSSDTDTAVNVSLSAATRTVALTRCVPRYAPVWGLNLKNTLVTANSPGSIRSQAPVRGAAKRRWSVRALDSAAVAVERCQDASWRQSGERQGDIPGSDERVRRAVLDVVLRRSLRTSLPRRR